MPYSIHDVLKTLGISEEFPMYGEMFTSETKVRSFNVEDAIKLFPELADVKNTNIIYAPVEMCHSLPSKNKRGRCFTLKTLRRSAGLVKDNLINFDHEISDNDIGATQERICGHLKGAALGMEDSNGSTPMFALSALYSRHPDVKEMAKEHMNGDPWFVSMECGHDILKSHLLLGSEFIPFREATSDMLRCIKPCTVLPYKGEELSLVVGGEDGVANFWGMALTKKPADTEGNILSMFAATAEKEVANAGSRKRFYLPLRLQIEQRGESEKLDYLEDFTDNLMKEAASIEVLGETSKTEEHSHEILSDGTVLPANGHSHYLKNFIITKGKNPEFSASLGDHDDCIGSDEYSGRTRTISHSHKLNISLKPSKSIKETSSLGEGDEDEMAKLLELLRKELATAKELASALKPEGDEKDKVGLALKAIERVESIDFDKAIADAVAEEIEARVEAGDLVSKEDHEKGISDKEIEVTDSINLENKKAERLTARLTAVTEAGLDLKGQLDDDTTIESFIKSIPLDDAGEKMFQHNLTIWKGISGKKEEKKEEKKEAANAPRVPILKLAGGGGGGGGGGGDADTPKFGKNAITVG